MKEWLPEELEAITCDFCGSHEVCAEYARGDGMRVVECLICGLAYLNPRPHVNFIPRFYEQDYFTGAAVERGEGGLRLELADTKKSGIVADKRMLRPIELMNSRFGGLRNKDILEIGCATGELLSMMANNGARVKGLEISDFAADIGRKRGLDVTTGTVEEYVAGTHVTFDAIMAFEVIEHVVSPTRFFKDVSKMVRPNGLLMLSTPNYACADSFGDKWQGFTSSFEHLYFYTADVLKRIACRSGFKLQHWETSLQEGVISEQENFCKRQLKRVSTATELVSENGIGKTISIKLTKIPRYVTHGKGHTLYTVFQRLDG